MKVGLALGPGLGLRSVHHRDFLEGSPPVDWLEVHAENFFARGGVRHETLLEIAERYPISLHAVGLSLGSPDGVHRDHLARLAALVADVSPILVSDHLAWSRTGDVYLNDLLPLPLDEGTLAVVSMNVSAVQDCLGRQILVENPSHYVRMDGSAMGEGEFLGRLVEVTGCGVLLDVNNLYVSAHNLGLDAREELKSFPAGAVSEIHIAGHEPGRGATAALLVDTHSTPVASQVWALLAAARAQVGNVPVLLERDADIPALDVLLHELSLAAGGIETSGTAAFEVRSRVVGPPPGSSESARAVSIRLATVERDMATRILGAPGTQSATTHLAAGFEVHRRNVLGSLERTLADAFPVSREVVGERFFRFLAAEFVRARPPRSACLADYGRELPDFLATFPPVAHIEYLPDLARLEWLRIVAFQAPCDAGPWVLVSEYPIFRIWEAHQESIDGDARIQVEPGTDRVTAWRDGWVVRISRADGSQASPFTSTLDQASGSGAARIAPCTERLLDAVGGHEHDRPIEHRAHLLLDAREEAADHWLDPAPRHGDAIEISG